MLAVLHLMSLYSRLLGRPFVYDHVRPWIVGGVDAGPAVGKLDAGPADVVLDVGCGTGVALRHLTAYARYVGIDPDPVAVGHARARFGGRPRVSFEVGVLERETLQAVNPTRAVLLGVLHHLDDRDAHDLLMLLRGSAALRRVVTLDIVFLEGQRLSNILALLDRGRYCRRRQGYERLARSAGWSVAESAIVRSHPTRGRALYLMLALEPQG